MQNKYSKNCMISEQKRNNICYWLNQTKQYKRDNITSSHLGVKVVLKKANNWLKKKSNK